MGRPVWRLTDGIMEQVESPVCGRGLLFASFFQAPCCFEPALDRVVRQILERRPDWATLQHRVIAVNLTSVMKLSRAVIRVMLKNGGGAIVTTSSGASFKSGIAGTAYTTSKHGLNGLVKSISTIYGSQGIRSNAVAPGGTATNIMDMSKPIRGAKTLEALGVNMANASGTATPDQIAACLLFLASDDASNVNGVIMASDGGWAAK